MESGYALSRWVNLAGLFVQYPSFGGSGGSSSGLSSVSFSIGLLDGLPANPFGASVSSNSIFMQSFTAVFPGLVNSASQTFGGVKTFQSPFVLPSLSPNAQLSLDGLGNVTVSSVSLISQVTGVLPLANMSAIPLNSLTATTGSISLTSQVVGVLSAANIPLIGNLNGSVSLTSQVVGVLPFQNMTPLLVGALDGALASVNGAVIGTNSLFLQSASTTNPGLINTGTTQSFTGIKSFTKLGVNNTSGNAGLFVVSSGLATNSLTIQGLSGQTSLGLNIINSAGNPAVVYDFNAGSFRLFVQAGEIAECNFDNRANVVTAAINSGSSARFNFLCAQQSNVTAGNGGGIAFGATITGSNTVTEYGYIWATKNNGATGDDDGSLHFATRSNATGKAQRCMDMDQAGNSFFYGNIVQSGALNGAITHSAGSSVAAYTIVYPSVQGSVSSFMKNDGSGNLFWGNENLNSVRLSSGSTSWVSPLNITTSTMFKITITGAGGAGGNALGLFSAGAGGGGGGTAIVYLSGLSSNTLFNYTIGNGGAVGSGSTAAGTSGQSSSFTAGSGTANIFIAAGGGGGGGGTLGSIGPTFGGVGGSASSNATIIIYGGSGGVAIDFSSANVLSGAGGSSFYAGQTTYGGGGTTGATGAAPGQGGGGGGSASATNFFSGGAGAGGAILIEWVV